MPAENGEGFVVKIGASSIGVVDGDIAELAVDAVVNSGNTQLYLGGRRSVAGALVRRTSGRVQAALDRLPSPIRLGAVVTTDGCGLPCKYIIHAATHGTRAEERASGLDPDVLRLRAVGDCVAAAVAQARKLGCRSLAIPMLATGVLRVPASLVVPTMVTALVEGLREGTALEAKLVVFRDPAILALVQRVVLSVTTAEQSPLQKFGVASGEAVLGTMMPLSGVATLIGASVGRRRAAKARHEGSTDGDRELSPLRMAVKELLHERSNLLERVRVLEDEVAQLQWEAAKHHGAVTDGFGGTAELALPAAYAVSMVRAEVSPSHQLENLRRALAILLRYLASLTLAEYQACGAGCGDTNAKITEGLHAVTGDGRWLAIAAAASKELRSVRPKLLENLQPMFWRDERHYGPLQGQLSRLVALRNEIHNAGRFDDAVAEDWLRRALPAWRGAIEHSLPLLRARLFYVEQPHDIEEGCFTYVVRWLMGDQIVPRAEMVKWSTPLRRNKLYLTDKDETVFLEMEPFLQYLPCDVTRAREVYSITCQTGDLLTLATFRFHSELPQSGVKLPFAAPAAAERREATPDPSKRHARPKTAGAEVARPRSRRRVAHGRDRELGD